MSFSFKRLARQTLYAFLVLIVLYLVYLAVILSTGNFHEVLKGELYRSGQLNPARMEEILKTHGIRSVYNLRGPNPGQAWYDQEKATVEGAGVQFIDFPMKASRLLANDQAHDLMESLKKAPKPVLIHCRAGADRTGLAVALYMAGIAQKGEEAAEAQLSPLYGHISLPFQGSFSMDQTFENLEDFFGYIGS